MHYVGSFSSSYFTNEVAFRCCVLIATVALAVLSNSIAAQEVVVPLARSPPAAEQNRRHEPSINVVVGASLMDLVWRINDKLQFMIDKMNNADHNVEMLKLKYETLSVKENYLDEKLSNFESRVNERLDGMETVINRTLGGWLDSMQSETQQKFVSLQDGIGNLTKLAGGHQSDGGQTN